MRLGLSWVPTSVRGCADIAQASESIGVDMIGVPDSQAARYRECYVTLTHILGATQRVLAGPLVTNPVTRHPAVAAAGMVAADEVSSGRAFICIGTGDSGVLGLGLKPAKLAALEEYVNVLRDLLTSGRATYRGAPLTIAHDGRPIPVYVAANGPKTLQLAGRLADGVVVGSGFTEDAVRLSRTHLADGAAAAGRSVDEIDVWYMARGAVADSREEALDLMRPSLAGSATHIFRFSTVGKAVPEEYVQPLRELQRRFDLNFKSIPGSENPNGKLLDELGLTGYLADRLGVVGTESECASKLERLRALGVVNIILRPLVVDRHDFLRRFERVMGAVS